MTRARRLLVSAAGVVFLALGGQLLAGGAADHPSSARPSPPAATTSSPPAPATKSTAPLVTPDDEEGAVPVRIAVPRLGIDSALDELRTGRGGDLEAPPRYERAGWFADPPLTTHYQPTT